MKSRKLNYVTRPSKHVERKIFVDIFKNLHKLGHEISDYTYVGLGSYYYADFILFNRHLPIKRMTCLENDGGIKKRMRFNQPYKFIDLRLEDCSSFITQIDRDQKYIVWLDFERKLNRNILLNAKSLASTLEKGSVLIITVNADAKEMKNLEFVDEQTSRRFEKIQIDASFRVNKEQLWPTCGTITKIDVSPSMLPTLYAKTLNNILNSTTETRPDNAHFYQLFNYVYQDGVRMLTFGGLIDNEGKESEIKLVFENITRGINDRKEPIKIDIPALTIREKLYLDQHIQDNKIAGGLKTLPFELEPQELKDYLTFAKYYPTFYEAIIN